MLNNSLFLAFEQFALEDDGKRTDARSGEEGNGLTEAIAEMHIAIAAVADVLIVDAQIIHRHDTNVFMAPLLKFDAPITGLFWVGLKRVVTGCIGLAGCLVRLAIGWRIHQHCGLSHRLTGTKAGRKLYR